MQVFTYWSGPVTWMERLSIASSRAMGHDITVYSYEPDQLRSEGLGVRIEDAREVLFDPSLGPLQKNKPDHFSDHFRLEGLGKALGTWVDLDLVFVRRLPEQELIFGWEGETSINGAVLRLPAGNPAQTDYLALCRTRPISPIAPWWPWKARVSRSLKTLSKRVRRRPVLAMYFGPEALTHFLTKHALLQHAAAKDVYYPAPPPWPGTRHFIEPDGVEPYITPQTRTVHIWHSLYRRAHGYGPPAEGSWLWNKCREYGIS